MTKSLSFWAAAVLLALVPIFIVDISEHYLSYRKDVREEFILVAQDVYAFTRDQKAQILDAALSKNVELNFLMYTKGFLCLVFVAGGVALLIRVHRNLSVRWSKLIVATFIVMVVIAAAKVAFVFSAKGSDNIHFIEAQNPTSLNDLITAANLKSKAVYVDFWGTTCGPCLMEFRNFTKPLKEKFNANEISYLYISQGQEYLWRKQIAKYDVEGYHVFLDDDTYAHLFRNAVGNDTATIFMPRYLITDSKGMVVVSDAKRPSDGEALFAELRAVSR